MAGRPQRRALIRAIELAGGVDRIFERIADGETMGEIADSLGFSRSLLSSYLRSRPEWSERLARAREQAAEAWADEILAIADRASPDDVKVAALRCEVRKWLAGIHNQGFRLSANSTHVSISANQLHLHAIRAFEDAARREVGGISTDNREIKPAIQALIEPAQQIAACSPEPVPVKSVLYPVDFPASNAVGLQAAQKTEGGASD